MVLCFVFSLCMRRFYCPLTEEDKESYYRAKRWENLQRSNLMKSEKKKKKARIAVVQTISRATLLTYISPTHTHTLFMQWWIWGLFSRRSQSQVNRSVTDPDSQSSRILEASSSSSSSSVFYTPRRRAAHEFVYVFQDGVQPSSLPPSPSLLISSPTRTITFSHTPIYLPDTHWVDPGNPLSYRRRRSLRANPIPSKCRHWCVAHTPPSWGDICLLHS